jgi:hypothetical protein
MIRIIFVGTTLELPHKKCTTIPQKIGIRINLKILIKTKMASKP